MIYELADFLTAVVESILFFSFFEVLLSRRHQIKRAYYLLGFIFLTGLIVFCNHIFLFSWQNISGMILSGFFISYIYQGSILKRVLAIIFACLLGIVTEVLTLFFLAVVLNTTTEDVISIQEYQLLGIIIAKVVALSICQIIILKKRRTFQYLGENKAYWTIFLISFLCFLVIVFWLFKLSYELETTEYNLPVMICSLCLLICMAMTLFLYERLAWQSKRIRIQEKQEQQLRLQMKHMEDLSAQQKIIQKFRHDVTNQLIVLVGYLENHDIQGGLQHIREFTRTIQTPDFSISTGNIALDTLLNAKKSLAESKGIIFKVHLLIPDHLPIGSADLCTIFGNALDNAIEACDRIEDKNKMIELSFGQYDRSLVCSIVNTAEKIDHPLFSTSKDDHANHGFGLQNIRETLEKYDSEPTIKWENGTFQLSFIIFI